MSIQHAWTLKLLLTPLQALYGDLNPVRLQVYLDALKGYSEDELRGVFFYIRDNYTYARFPSIAELQEARSKVSLPALPKPDTVLSWVERDRKIQTLLDAYFHELVRSPIYKKADQEGWESYYRKYCMEVARIQAQIIYPAHSDAIGLDAFTLKLGHNDIKGFIQEQRGRVADKINVAVPADLIEDWMKKKVA